MADLILAVSITVLQIQQFFHSVNNQNPVVPSLIQAARNPAVQLHIQAAQNPAALSLHQAAEALAVIAANTDLKKRRLTSFLTKKEVFYC